VKLFLTNLRAEIDYHILANGAKFVGAPDTRIECEKLGIKKNVTYLKCGETAEVDGIKITGVPCDHGELAPDALGFWIEIDGKSVYYMGDTAFRKDYFESGAVKSPDILIAPINGMFGNLDPNLAADAAEIIQPKITVPCHFWNFAEHEGNPNCFLKAMKERGLNHKLLRIGEGIII